MSEARKQVTNAIAVAYSGGKVHLNLDFHIGDINGTKYDTFFSQGVLLPPAVARRLGEALIEVAAAEPVPAVSA